MCLVAAAALAAAPSSAAAQGIKRIGAFGDWSSFQFTEDGNAACYMSSEPQKSVGEYKKRGEVYAIVTHRPAEQRIGEVSIIAGYSYKKDSTVEIAIGEQAFDLFTQDDGAWAPDADTDKRLVQAMRKGRTMVVKGTSSRGTLTTDTYSLSGFTKAYGAISKACGL
jgi:invasion protein IalB